MNTAFAASAGTWASKKSDLHRKQDLPHILSIMESMVRTNRLFQGKNGINDGVEVALHDSLDQSLHLVHQDVLAGPRAHVNAVQGTVSGHQAHGIDFSTS